MTEETREERIARWRSVGVSAAAMPTRKGTAKAELDRTKRWEKENDAFASLAKQGITAPSHEDAPAMLQSLESLK